MDRVFDWLILALYVAVVFLLVRPKSQGPALVQKFTDGVVNIVRSVTGGGSWSG
jgi:hypothetical protein